MGRKNEAFWTDKRKLWKIQVQKDGERKSFSSSTKGKAGKIEAEKKADAWLDIGEVQKNIRFGEAWEEYLEQVQILTGTANYKQAVHIGKNWLLPKLRHKYIRNITDQDWQNCINEAYKMGRYLKTLKNIRGKISNFCKFARKARYMDQPPIDLVVPKDAPVKDRNILQPEALQKLFTDDTELWRGKLRPAFFIYAFRFDVVLGLRRGELCGLKHSDIKNGVLYIQRASNEYGEMTKGKNKNARRRIVLSEIAEDILADQTTMLKSKGIISPYIFPEADGNALRATKFYREWNRFRKTHDLNCDIQGLRRTMVSMIKNDMPEDMAKRVVGHSKDMDTYGIYGREVDGELEMAASIIDKVFGKLLNKRRD